MFILAETWMIWDPLQDMYFLVAGQVFLGVARNKIQSLCQLQSQSTKLLLLLLKNTFGFKDLRTIYIFL